MGRAILNGDVPEPPAELLPAMMDAVTHEFLKANPDLSDADPNEILRVYTKDMRNDFAFWNGAWGYLKKDKEGKDCVPPVILSQGGQGGIMYPKELPAFVIGDLLARRHKWVNINLANISGAEPSKCELGVYIEDGPRAGIYDVTDDTKLRHFRELCPQLCDAKCKLFADIESRIKNQAPILRRTGDKDDEKHFVPVANGVFDLQEKVLLPFSSNFVYTAKAEVPYNPTATSPVITEPSGESWDFESWLLDLVSDVEEDKDAILQSMNFALRPASVSSKIMFWISNNFGSSGKGTLAQVLENLLGGQAVKHATLDDIAAEYNLYDLPSKSLIIGYDNERGYRLDKVNKLKLLATKEPIQANRKFRDPVTFRFNGANVQLTNGYPTMNDRSDSNLRRYWLFNFDKDFSASDIEKKYIKSDYLRRPEVLKYVMKRLLELPYLIELPETENTKACMAQLRGVNSVVYDFVDEVMPVFPKIWDAYDGLALYKIFTKWATDHGRDEQYTIKASRFYDELAQALRNRPKFGFKYDPAKCLTYDSRALDPILQAEKQGAIWEIIKTYTHDDFVQNKGRIDEKLHNLRVRGDTGLPKYIKGCIVREKTTA